MWLSDKNAEPEPKTYLLQNLPAPGNNYESYVELPQTFHAAVCVVVRSNVRSLEV